MSLVPNIPVELEEARRRIQALELRVQALPTGSVGADQVNWAQMPPVRLASWISNNDGAYSVTDTSSFGSPLPGADNIATVQSLLPARAGYTRQYRLRTVFVHVNAGGESSFAWVLGLYYGLAETATTATTGVSAAYSSSTVTTRVATSDSGWVGNTILDGLPDGSRFSLFAYKDYVGGNPPIFCRSVALEGRYVPA